MMSCTTCKATKDIDAFHKSKSHPKGLYPICRSCRQVATKKYAEIHGDKIRLKWREAHKANPEKHRQNARNYQSQNWEYRKAYMRQWTKDNPGKANAHTAKRFAAKIRATPPWLTKKQLSEISWFYETAKEVEWLSDEPLHVDHIEPLRGKNSCGLHVPWNLQIISASKNCSKGNKLDYPT